MFAPATLHTDRFLLRQFSADDLPFVFEGLSHPEVIRYYGVNYSTLEETNNQLIWFREIQENETGMWWAICDKTTLSLLGAIGFNDLSKSDQKAEIGFWLLPEYWGLGIIKEAASAVFGYASKVLNLAKIVALVEAENNNSKKLVKKLDFIYQETLWNCEIKNDNPISLEIYEKIISE
ncbi:GNAT family N-acetyltransferase [Pedobacter sp. KBW01]|uniref:GNAT family N-acetyltransferase n=1 Tax=Pedobacter sp. KBW01 TaxID=2153364 RepID=UPI000F5A2A5B|nr:GNAT family N-acetyltransferase [Pedobacter sp. KBW01]RQO65627.1 GNAT family N-acetyltransferase [Pedobacter sp. KBW01]